MQPRTEAVHDSDNKRKYTPTMKKALSKSEIQQKKVHLNTFKKDNHITRTAVPYFMSTNTECSVASIVL